MIFGGAYDRNMPVFGFIDVIGCERQATMAIADSLRNFPFAPVDQAEVGGQGWVGSFLHRNFDKPADTSPGAIEQRSHNARVEMHAT